MKEKKDNEACALCGSPLNPIETTPSGKKLQRCAKGAYNPETKKVEGCQFVKWYSPEPEKLEEKCPKCGESLIMITTRSGKLLKKCSTAQWDPKSQTASGCDHIEWYKGETRELDELCPTCNSPIMYVVTARGKKMKKCSTNRWDQNEKKTVGCSYVEWIND